MEVSELLLPDGRPSGVWKCGKCGRAHAHNRAGQAPDSEWNREQSQACCDRRCQDCKAPLERLSPYAICRGCLTKHDEQRRTERFEKATKLTVAEWGASDAGPMLYSEDRDRWFDDLDGVDEWVAEADEDDEDEPRERPAYLWCTTPIKWQPDVAGDLADEMHSVFGEDSSDQIPPDQWKRLEKFVGSWWAQNKITSYQPDFTRCVLLPVEPKGAA